MMSDTDYQKLPLEDPKDEAQGEVKAVRIPKKKKGCCCCCMKICLILFAVFFGLFVLATAFMYFKGKELVRKVTVTTPKELPVVDIPQAKLDLVKDRAMLFIATIRAGDVPEEDLVITAEEVNGYYGQSDFLRGNIYSTLSKGEIKTEFSLPTYFLPGGSGRYFVGKEVIAIDRQAHEVDYDLDIAAFPDSPLVLAVMKYVMDKNIEFNSEHLDIYLKSLKILGEDKAEGFIAKNYNLLEDFYKNPGNSDAAYVILQIESISIENNSIVIKPRRGSDGINSKARDIAPILFEKTKLRGPNSLS